MLGDFDEIHLLASRPVQSEIDNQKNKGRDRLGQRARVASRLFREAILDPGGCKVAKDGKPLVRLFIRQELKRSTVLSAQLDYQERDDQLVGIAHAFAQENPGLDVRLLTHDTGPMASAKMVGVPVAAIFDEWLVPPESSETEKTIKALEHEIARLKKAEPVFSIEYLNEEGKSADRLEFELMRYEPLGGIELSELMSRIKNQFPLATDFGPREPTERPSGGVLGFFSLTEAFTPATDKEIAAYRKKYESWLDQCEKKLGVLHDTLQIRAGAPVFRFVAINEGTRPAKDVLVAIEAKGQFMIRPPLHRESPPESLVLPSAPSPPRGTWKSTSDLVRSYTQLMAPGNSLGPIVMSAKSALGSLVPERHDQNAFYYKGGRLSSPAPRYESECQQWRHRTEPKIFNGEIHVDKDEGVVTGLLECRIHAENLSDVVIKRVPVKIRIKHIQVYDVAKTRVDCLIAGISL
jgi:hypothetical protein